jgi:hypothetical protein
MIADVPPGIGPEAPIEHFGMAIQVGVNYGSSQKFCNMALTQMA